MAGLNTPFNRVCCIENAFVSGLLPEDFEQRTVFYEGFPKVALPNELQVLGEGYAVNQQKTLFIVPLPGHAAGHIGFVYQLTQAGYCSQVTQHGLPLITVNCAALWPLPISSWMISRLITKHSINYMKLINAMWLSNCATKGIVDPLDALALLARSSFDVSQP